MLFAAVQAFSHQTCCRVATTAACALPIYVALYNTKTKLKPAIMILKVMLNMGVNNVIQMCVCVCVCVVGTPELQLQLGPNCQTSAEVNNDVTTTNLYLMHKHRVTMS